MKKEKKKCYVLMISKVFPATHPKKGQPTNFKQKIEEIRKLHTIRGSYKLWEKRIAEVNAGNAFISLRQWEGKPYKSKQFEFMQLHAGKVGIQKCEIITKGTMKRIKILIDGEEYPIERISAMDGLNPFDLYYWMNPKCQNLHMKNHCVIHFTGHIYDKTCKKI